MTKKSKPGKTASMKRASRNVQRDDTTENQATQEDIMTRKENTGGVPRAEEGYITTNKVITENNIRTPLLQLPSEVKQKIWILAITVDDPIEPLQLLERSNKFIWSEAQVDDKGTKIIKNAETLTAVQLSRACKTMYEEVALTHLFYKVNRFQFTLGFSPALRRMYNCAELPLSYLVSLTPPRLNAIRSITCSWTCIPAEASKLFTVLATIDGLQELILLIHANFWRHIHNLDRMEPHKSKVPGYKDALIAVEGLQALELEICTRPSCCCHHTATFQPAVTKLEQALRGKLKEARGKTKYRMDFLARVQREVKLDIHGDGRLGDDKKPSMIASRTRNQLRKLETLTDDGTIPRTVIPKYDSEGNLAWLVRQVTASRKSEPEGFPSSAEFKVNCVPLIDMRTESDLPVDVSWEDVSVFGCSYTYRSKIVIFYRENPSAYGKEQVVEAWNLRDLVSTPKEIKAVAGLTKTMLKIIEVQAKIEEREAEARAKKAAKAARRGLKGQKKTMRG